MWNRTQHGFSQWRDVYFQGRRLSLMQPKKGASRKNSWLLHEIGGSFYPAGQYVN